MFCRNCFRHLEEGETLCPACGTVNESASSTGTVTAGIETEAVPFVDEELKTKMSALALKWGIISLVFAATGCLSLLGFIFSFIAKSKALAYERTFGVLEGKARVGRILGKVGFGVGLGMTIYMGFAVFVGVLAGLAEAGVM